MKRIILVIAATTCVANARAGTCPEVELLAKRYGITFSGFITPIPAVTLPDVSKQGRLLHLRIVSPDLVSDGFRHKILFDSATRKAWALRTGGFAGVRQWYGPVDAGAARLENCLAEAERIEEPLQNS